MIYRFVTVLAAMVCAAALAATPVGAAESEEKEGRPDGRRFDLELFVGAQVGTTSNFPVDDNLLYGGNLAMELFERIDLEGGMMVSDTHTVEDENFNSEHQTVNYVYGGFRYYPFFDPDGRTRPYVFTGVTQYWGLEPGKSKTGYMFGPGIRFQPGDQFGFGVRMPMVVQFNDESFFRLMPLFSRYWSFNWADRGFH